MQHKLLVSILISFLTLTVSAAPVPAPVPDSILDREIWRVPSVGVTDVARDVAPTLQTERDEHAPRDGVTDAVRAVNPPPQDLENPDVERDTEEARGCRMYACI